MITIHVKEGHSHQARTTEQLVMLLWKAAFITESSPHTYMKAVAARVLLATGDPVRTDTPAHFLNDLADTGLITIEGEDNS